MHPEAASLPRVSILIPCLNEERFLARCLDSILANDYPLEMVEIIVVDGGSTDSTPQILEQYCRDHRSITRVANPRRIIPAALNAGLAKATGDVIMRMDAHTTYAPDYIRHCVAGLEQYAADNVGGLCVATPSVPTRAARAVALVLKHRFGTGGSHFRSGSDRVREVDAVSFGCFRRSVFDRIGGFDERLERSEDYEFNRRLRHAGGKIVLIPSILSNYYPSATLAAFWRHNFHDGRWAILPKLYLPLRFSARHYAPGAFAGGLVLLLLLGLWLKAFWYLLAFVLGGYFVVSIAVAVSIARSERDPGLFFPLLGAFTARHIGYGLGSLAGALRLALGRFAGRHGSLDGVPPRPDAKDSR